MSVIYSLSYDIPNVRWALLLYEPLSVSLSVSQTCASLYSPLCAFLCPHPVGFSIPHLCISVSPWDTGTIGGVSVSTYCNSVVIFLLQRIEIIYFQNSLVGVKKLKMKTLIRGTCAINILLSRDIQCFMMVTICFQTTSNSIWLESTRKYIPIRLMSPNHVQSRHSPGVIFSKKCTNPCFFDER